MPGVCFIVRLCLFACVHVLLTVSSASALHVSHISLLSLPFFSQCVVLSDRADTGSMDPSKPPLPALLAVGAVHHHLIKTGGRLCVCA